MTYPLGSTGVRVRMEALPLVLWAGLRQWFEEVRREISLAGLSRDQVAADTMTALAELMSRQARSLGTEDRGAQRLWDALEAGNDRVDFDYVVTPEAAGSSAELLAAMDSLDGLCRSGVLLALPLKGNHRALAQWYFGEIQSQVAGSVASPWPGPWTEPS